MRHVLVLAQWDLRRRWREGGTALVIAALIGLLAAAGGAGVVRTSQERLSSRKLHEREQALRQAIATEAGPSTSPSGALPWNLANPDYVANDRGTLAIAPPPPLSVLSVGQTTRYPTEVKVTASGQVAGMASTELTPPLRLSLNAFDVEFVLVVLWPLAIIAVSADAVSAERERGTLALLLSRPVSPATIVLASLSSRAAIVIGPALVVSWAAGLADGSSQALRPLLWWSAGVIAYGSFWLGLATWITSGSHSSAAAAVRLAGAWLFVTLVAPGLIQVARVTWGGVPSDVVLADATRAATRDAMTDGSRVLGHFLEDHPTASAVGRDGLRQYALLQAARDEEVARRLAPVISRFRAAAERQRRLTRLLQPLSPALVASQFLQQAAGTSDDRARDFARQVAAFRTEWRAFLQPRIFSGVPLTGADADALPLFVYIEHDPMGTDQFLRLSALVWLGGLGASLVYVGIRRLSAAPFGTGRT